MEEDSYIERKIDFVTGHTGSSVWDINQVTLIAPAAALLWAVLQTRQRFFDPYTPAAYIADFLIQVGAILFAVTVYSDNPIVLLGLILVPAIGTLINGDESPLKKQPAKPPVKDENAEPGEPVDVVPIKPFITTYRGAMMIITCISILAVDFHVFPRRFAKVENWGQSLMDLGVGSFVFGAGLVYSRQQLKDEASETEPQSSFLGRMLTSIKHSLPMIALGFVRLWSVKGLEYQEHVTEYGVHWNFFFTLGLLPPFVTLVQPVLKFVPSHSLLGFIMLMPYEGAFVYSKLGFYMFMAPRVDFLSSNREGIFSLVGYLAIFIIGQGIGLEALRRDVNAATPVSGEDEWVANVLGGEDSLIEVRKTREHSSLLKLAKWTAIWIVAYIVMTNGRYGPRLTTSRRLANMPYVAWVAAFNCGQLLFFRVIEGFLFPHIYTASDKKTERERAAKATSKVLHAFNRNGLVIFCLANLLTGVVNMTMPTLDMSDFQSMAVLVGYMSILTATGLLLDYANITIRL